MTAVALESVEEKILKGIAIPPKPQVLMDIQKAGDDLQKIAAAIARDVSLTAAVLRVANAPAMGFRREIASIEQATALLGLRQIRTVVQGVALKGAVGSSGKRIEEFWALSMDIAMLAAEISSFLKVGKKTEIFTLALFHNSGIPLLMQRYENYHDVLRRAFQRADGRVLDTEYEELSTNHALIGYFLCRSWNLPEAITIAVREHHNVTALFRSNVDNSVLDDIAVLKVAEYCADIHSVLGGCERNFEFERIAETVLGYLGMSPAQFHNLVDHLGETVVLEI